MEGLDQLCLPACITAGTWAEYVSVKEEYLAKAPSSLSLSEAAGAGTYPPSASARAIHFEGRGADQH